MVHKTKKNTEKLATYGTQDEENKTKTQYHLCWTPLCTNKHNVRFVLTCSFVEGSISSLLEGACRVCVVYACLCIMLSNTYCVFGFVFLRLVYHMLPVSLCFLRLVYHVLPVSLDCPFVIAPSVFSNVYINHSVYAHIVQSKIMRQILFLSLLSKDQPGFVLSTTHYEIQCKYITF